MGAQVERLLTAGAGALGDVPATWPVRAVLALPRPPAYRLDVVARSHGGVGLAPSAYDGTCLHRVLGLPGGTTRVAVGPDLRVRMDRAGDEAGVRAQLGVVLGLDDDLSALWEACDRVPSLRWVRPRGAGRLLRAPTVFEDLVGVLAATNTSYAATRRMVGALVGDGAFPLPGEVAALGGQGLRECGWGYRAGPLLALARGVSDGALDVEAFRGQEADEVGRRVQALAGFGPFAAAQVLALLGLPRPWVLDGWLRRQAGPGARERLAPMGVWAGTGLWLEVSGRWLRG